MSEAQLDENTEIPIDVSTEAPANPPPEDLENVSSEPQAEEPAATLSEQEQLEIEKRRKRCERFGEPFDVAEATAAMLKARKKVRRPKITQTEEEKKKIEEREKKFGVILTRPTADKHFEKKVDITSNDEIKLRPDTLHVFGVDFLSTGDIMKFFNSYHPQKVEWINDSSCNIIFETESYAQEAYRELTLTKKYDSEWRQSFPINKDGVNFTLEFRFATDKDAKNSNTTGKASQYYKYVKEKHQEKKKKDQKSGRKYNERDDYNDRSGIMKKNISKNRTGRKSKKDKDDEEVDEDIKEIRENREKETQEEEKGTNKEDEQPTDSNNQHDNGNNHQEKNNDMDIEANNKQGQRTLAETNQDQDLDL